MDEEEVKTNDKGKITALVMIIIFIVLLIIGFLIMAVLDITSESKQSKNYSTTTRRTMVIDDITTTEEVKESTTTSEANKEEALTTTVESNTTKETSALKTTVAKTSKAAAKQTTEVVTEKVTEVVNPAEGDRTVVTDATTYPDSLNDWEWQIVDLINEDRTSLGLSKLSVAKELRALAEEGADLMLGSSEDVVKNYLYGHNNYRMWSNKGGESPSVFYQKVKNAVGKVTTSSSFKYLGVGVLYKTCGQGCMPTYYFVLIYE